MSGRKRVRLGRIHADVIAFDEAVAEIIERASEGRGGFVVTPNVDHVVLAEDDEGLRAAYGEAALSLVDGTPLLWMARALGHPLPEKISGSDLARPLLAAAAAAAVPVFLLGAREEVSERAAAVLKRELPALRIAGRLSPPLGFERDPALLEEVLTAVREAKPALVLVFLGCPKQELFMRAHAAALSPAVLVGLGATVDFLAGEVKRAPAWMSSAGLEWTWRLAQEPRRMAHRYLVRDRAIGGVFLRMLRLPARERAFFEEPAPEGGSAVGGARARL